MPLSRRGLCAAALSLAVASCTQVPSAVNSSDGGSGGSRSTTPAANGGQPASAGKGGGSAQTGGAGGTRAGMTGSGGATAGTYAGGNGDGGSGGNGTTGGNRAAEPLGTSLLVGVGSWGLRARSADAAQWNYCGNPSTGNDHSPDLLRDVGYGDGVFVAVGGDQNAMVMRSLDGEHWEQDLHPLTACPGEGYPSSCSNWMGGVAFLDGVWLAGGGNGATMRSDDAGRTWHGLHRGFPEKHIRTIGAGAGRFIAGTDGGGLYVTADGGDSWTGKSVWSGASSSSVLRVAYGNGIFIAYSTAGDACFLSRDNGDNWQACPSAAQGGSSFVFDGKRWVAAQSGKYATSPDALSWTAHTAQTMPQELLFDGTTWYGRSAGRFFRAQTLDSFSMVAADESDFRGLVLGKVIAGQAAAGNVPACVDMR